MKIYLFLLNVLFASTAFAFEISHHYKGKYFVTYDCKNVYVCNYFGLWDLSCSSNPNIPNCKNGKHGDAFYNCINQYGDMSSLIPFEVSKNPFTECKNSPNYHTANIKISDCRTSLKKGDSDFSFTVLNDNVESRSFNYFTADGVHDRVFTGFGWCKYNNLSGRCGAANGLNCRSGQCCSKYNYCGTTSDYCKKGCQGHFGHCN